MSSLQNYLLVKVLLKQCEERQKAYCCYLGVFCLSVGGW